MKTKKLLISALVLLSVVSCNKDTLSIPITFDAPEMTFTMPAQPIAGNVTINNMNFNFNMDSLCKANSINISQIKSVKIHSCEFTILDTGLTFDFLDKISTYIGSSGLADQKFASIDPVLKDHVTTLPLSVPDVELVNYLKSGKATVSVSAQSNAPVLNPVRMKAKMQVTVVGNLIN